jgi:hypothetical protein
MVPSAFFIPTTGGMHPSDFRRPAPARQIAAGAFDARGRVARDRVAASSFRRMGEAVPAAAARLKPVPRGLISSPAATSPDDWGRSVLCPCALGLGLLINLSQFSSPGLSRLFISHHCILRRCNDRVPKLGYARDQLMFEIGVIKRRYRTT